jgi:hypothetical protein
MDAPTSLLGAYRRTLVVSGLVLVALVLSFVPMWPAEECASVGGGECLITVRRHIWVGLYDFFLWLETTPFGVIGKTWGAAFALVEAVHLLGMALLGGAVFVSDARLLGVGFKDIPCHEILEKAHKVFFWGLVIALSTGIFMACGVAGKIYFLPVYWYKMLALVTGILFVYFIKRPMLQRGVDNLSPLMVRLLAVSSIMVWVTVAATGRWIGFAGS